MAFGDYATLLSSFTGADESPLSEGGNWGKLNSADSGDLKRLSNAVSPTSGNTGSRYWTPATFGPNVEAYLTITTEPVLNEAVFVLARLGGVGGSNTWDGYQMRYTNKGPGSNEFAIVVVTNNSGTVLTTANEDLVSGDKVGIRCNGSTIEGWHYNGTSWSMVVTTTDTTWSGSGNVGMRGSGTATVIDDFFAGTITAATKPKTLMTLGVG